MQPTSFLGIYISKDHATAVCVAGQGRDRTLAGCFTVSIDPGQAPTTVQNRPAPSAVEGPAEPQKPASQQDNQQGQSPENAEQQPESGSAETGISPIQELVYRVAAGCAERRLKFDGVAVAIDCAMFMQHSVHSEFAGAKRISQTVRFDTEEVLGTDASDVAIAFKIGSTDSAGSNLSVFTTPKHLLAELLTSLQANSLDPVNIEPDVNCLARFVCNNITLPADTHPLFGLLSRRNGYFIAPLASPWLGVSPVPAASMRTFLLGGSQNRSELLARQISMTTALLGATSSVDRLEVFDAAGSINYGDVARKFTALTEPLDIAGSVKLPTDNPDLIGNCPDAVELAIAYGAAIWNIDPPQTVNWRNDFMPYQAEKLRLQSSLKFFSIAAVILMLALGVFGLMQVLQIQKYRAALREKFAKDYSTFMLGQKPPAKSQDAVTRLGTALRRIRDAQKSSFSLSGDEAVAGKLTLVFQAFNKCASATGLNIDTLNISDKSIAIMGSTSSPENTLKVFEALKQTNLNVLQQSMASEAGRGTFNVTVEPKKASRASEPAAATGSEEAKPPARNRKTRTNE